MSSASGRDEKGAEEPTTRDVANALRVLDGGTDAVLAVRRSAPGQLAVEFANEAATRLFGAGPIDASSVQELGPIVGRIADALNHDRATRQHVALMTRDGDRLVVDLQLEPMASPDAPRVLAVIRLADARPTSADTTPAVGVFRSELGLGVVFVDDAVLAMLGLSHEQALGQGWLDAIHADDRERVARALSNEKQPDDVVDIECRIVRAISVERPARIRAVPVRGDGGLVTGYLGSLEDLTDERRNAQAVARLSQLADVIDEWIVVVDPELRLRYANPAATTGLALPDVQHLSDVRVEDLIPPERREVLLAALGGSLANASTWSGNAVVAALDGRRVDLDATVVAHRGADGAVAHYSLLGRDVTSLRTVQRALEESQERFRLIADASPTGIYFVGEDGRVSYANRRLAVILGEQVDTVVGHSLLEWVHDSDQERTREKGASIVSSRQETSFELCIQRRSGDVRWVRAQGAPVLDADGNMYGVVGSIADITDERAAARGLAMLSRAVESTADLVTFHDRDGRMFFANSAARAFFGVGADDPVPPLEPADYIDASEQTRDEIARALLESGHWAGELVAVGAHGSMPVEVAVAAHYDERGEIEYYSALSRDLTERRHAENARRRSEAVLRAIVQSSPLAIFALDRQGRTHVWNTAAEELFGWRARDVVGERVPFLDDDERDEFDAVVGRVFGGRTVKGYLARYRRRDGGTVDVDVSIAPLRNTDGRVVTAVAVLADVSEQIRATQAVHASEVWFRSLVQHSSDMVMVIDEAGAISYVSPRSCEFAGVQPEEVLGRRVNEVFSAVDDDLATLQAVFARLRSDPANIERATFRIERADGERRWIEMAASNLLDDAAVRGIVINARDITESFEAQANVQASEERLQALVSSVTDAIVVLAEDGSVTYSSPVAEAMFGTGFDGDPESVFTAIDPADLPRALELWEQTRTTPGIAPAAEVRIHRHDGTALDAEVIANNLLHDPSVRGIVMTIRDITDRKRSDDALRDTDARLRESEARYRAVVDDQVELVCRHLPDSTITFVNRAFADFYGRSREELVGTRLTDLQPPTARDEYATRMSHFGVGVELQTHDEWELAPDGSPCCHRWIDRAFLDDRANVIEVQSVGHDVTEERRAAVLTANQADILEQVARGIPLDVTLDAIASAVEQHFAKLSCAVFLLDADGTTLKLAASPTLPRDALTDNSLEALWTAPILAADGKTTLGIVATYGREQHRPDEEQRRILSLVARLASIAIEREAFEDQLAHQSMHDPLSGLPNRVLFLDRLALAVARGRRTQTTAAVLFLDLDRFKNVNDSLGHDVGDELLVSVARRLESMLRPGDTVARFGGDEFTILCEDLEAEPRDHAVEIASRLLDALAQPFVVRDVETYVGLSIGIALATGDESADELMRDADAALYHAKEAGRGRVVVFDDTIRERALVRHSTENALHRAIERDEMRLFFQPIVRLDDARCVGTEALVRWQHPERGLVLPAEFVPLAEETGLVVPLGMWVLERAAAQAAKWQLEYPDFSVSVNLSARQLADPDLTTQVADVIKRTGVTPENLCFEITESALMDDAEAVMRVIEELRGLGVRFAIDDFGTGYSSLGYLKRFSVDTVKIDRAFVDGLADDPGDHAIVSAVIGLAHALGLNVVAEGVETEAQLVELVALGCDEAQGYFFAPPQPAVDLRALVSAARRWRPPGSPVMGRS